MFQRIIPVLAICCVLARPVSAQPLNDAIAQKDTALAIKLMAAGANVNEVDKYGSSLLMTACRWGQDTTVKFLLAHGATVDRPKSPKGRTPLMVACAYYSGKKIVKMMIDKGASVNEVAADGATALMLAAQNCKTETVRFLLEKGADPKKKDSAGRSALDYAKAAQELQYIKNAVKDDIIDQAMTLAILEKAMK